MNHTLSTIFVLLIGLIGGLIGSSLSSGPATEYDLSIDGAKSSNEQELQDQISALQSSYDSLRHQFDLQATSLAQLEDRLQAVPAADASGEGFAFADVPTGQSFEGQINAVIERREAQQNLEREEERATRRAEALDRRVQRMAEELNLDAYQTEQMAKITAETSEKRDAFFSEMRELGAMDRDEIRSQMTELRENEMSQLEGVLTPEQLTQYTEMNSRGFGGRGGNSGQGGNRGGNSF